jgi:hypothetical protein
MIMMARKKTFRKTHSSVAWLVLRMAVALALVGWMAGSCRGSAHDTTRVSVSSSEAQADNWSAGPTISSDGRFVAFESEASNLVASDTNGFIDAFVHDLQTGATERVSVNSSGKQGNLESGFPSIRSDGRFVAFQSLASDLVANDTNNTSDVFVRDLRTGATERVSVSSSEAQADNWSDRPSISFDGSFVAFESIATNLAANDTNGFRDVFVRDLQTGTTQRVSIDSSGEQGNLNSYRPTISSDGRFVAFGSEASNLVAKDTNNAPDIFVRDRQGGTTERVSVSSSEAQADGFNGRLSISSDGRFVAFGSEASNLVANDINNTSDVFVRDLWMGTTQRVSVSSSEAQADNWSDHPSISSNGRFVAFESEASNLVANDTNGFRDAFVRDLWMGTTQRVSMESSGKQGNFNSYDPSISSDGRFVAFESEASNLVAKDTNNTGDVFVRELPDTTGP